MKSINRKIRTWKRDITSLNKRVSGKISSLKNNSVIEIEVEKADELFEKEKETEIGEAEKKADNIHSDTEKCLKDLTEVLKELEKHSDYKDRQVIEDVVSNIAFRRRRMIEDLELPQDPRELKEEIDSLIEDFQDLSQKEEAVIEEAVIPDSFHKQLRKLDECQDRIERQLEYHNRVIERQENLEEMVSRYKEIQKQIEKLEKQEKPEILKEKSEQLENIEKKLEELEQSQEWQDYEALEDEIDDLESEKTKIERKLGRASQKMQRGLKKLIYKAENGDLTIDSEIEILKQIQNGEKQKLLDQDPEKVKKALEEAEESLPKDLLNPSQEEKFLDGASILSEISQHKNRIDEIEEEINTIKQKKETHTVLEKKEELEKKKKQVEDELEDKKAENEELKNKIEQKRLEKTEIRDKIRKNLSSGLKRKVEFEK